MDQVTSTHMMLHEWCEDIFDATTCGLIAGTPKLVLHLACGHQVTIERDHPHVTPEEETHATTN